MRAKQYLELSRRMLKINRASNRSITRGLIIGFTLLIPIISLLFSVNINIDNYIEKHPYLLNFETLLADYRITTGDWGEKHGNSSTIYISGSNHIDYVTDNEKITRSIIYENAPLNDYNYDPNEPLMQFAIGSNELNDIAFRANAFANIIDIDKSDSYFPRNYTEFMPGGIYLNGYDAGFSGDGKGQVILSERFLTDNSLTPESVYLKTFTVKSNNKMYLNGEYVPVEGYLCKNYTVVGIIRAEAAENSPEYGFMSAQMFFTSASVYDEHGTPVLKPIKADGKRVFKNWDNRAELNEEYMMLGWYAVSRFYKENSTNVINTHVYAEADSYNELKYQYNQLNKRFTEAVGFPIHTIKTSELFESYPQLTNIANIAGYLLLTVGIVIGLSAMLSLFNSINHSVRTRRQYLTMMRAIGAKDRDIPRLFVTESALLSLKVCSITGVLGFLIGMAIKLIYEERQSIVYLRKYILDIPWHVIIIVPIVTVILVFAINLLYSYIASRRLAKTNIASIINND